MYNGVSDKIKSNFWKLNGEYMENMNRWGRGGGQMDTILFLFQQKQNFTTTLKIIGIYKKEKNVRSLRQMIFRMNI